MEVSLKIPKWYVVPSFVLRFKQINIVILNIRSECGCMCQSYTFQLMINTGRQHDAGHDSFQQEDDRVDDSGHCGVSGAQAAAAQQTCCSAAETWDLKQRPNV